MSDEVKIIIIFLFLHAPLERNGNELRQDLILVLSVNIWVVTNTGVSKLSKKSVSNQFSHSKFQVYLTCMD